MTRRRTTALIIAACALSAQAFVVQPSAASVPCEDKLAELRAVYAKAQPDAATKTKVDDLMQKGIERCNADDDRRADDFLQQAIDLLGK